MFGLYTANRVRYLVVAVCQSGSRVAASGEKVYVLFVGLGNCLEICLQRDDERDRYSEHVSHLAAFRIEKVTEATCPNSAWRWARTSPQDCAELLDRCTALRDDLATGNSRSGTSRRNRSRS